MICDCESLLLPESPISPCDGSLLWSEAYAISPRSLETLHIVSNPTFNIYQKVLGAPYVCRCDLLSRAGARTLNVAVGAFPKDQSALIYEDLPSLLPKLILELAMVWWPQKFTVKFTVPSPSCLRAVAAYKILLAFLGDKLHKRHIRRLVSAKIERLL
jgi:hypothetical protein